MILQWERPTEQLGKSVGIYYDIVDEKGNNLKSGQYNRLRGRYHLFLQGDRTGRMELSTDKYGVNGLSYDFKEGTTYVRHYENEFSEEPFVIENMVVKDGEFVRDTPTAAQPSAPAAAETAKPNATQSATTESAKAELPASGRQVKVVATQASQPVAKPAQATTKADIAADKVAAKPAAQSVAPAATPTAKEGKFLPNTGQATSILSLLGLGLLGFLGYRAKKRN